MGLTPSIKEYLKHKAGRETGFFDDKVSHYKYELKRRFEERKEEPIKEIKLMKEAGELTKDMRLQLATLLNTTKDVNRKEALQEITEDMSKNNEELIQLAELVNELFGDLAHALPRKEQEKLKRNPRAEQLKEILNEVL